MHTWRTIPANRLITGTILLALIVGLAVPAMGQVVQDREHDIHQSGSDASSISVTSTDEAVHADRQVTSGPGDTTHDNTGEAAHNSEQDAELTTLVSQLISILEGDGDSNHGSSHETSSDSSNSAVVNNPDNSGDHVVHDHSHDQIHGSHEDNPANDPGHNSSHDPQQTHNTHNSHNPHAGAGFLIPPVPPAYEAEGIDHPIMYDDRGRHQDPRFHDRPDLYAPPESPTERRSILGGLIRLEHPHDGDRYREDCPRHRHTHGPGWHHGDWHNVRHIHMHGHC